MKSRSPVNSALLAALATAALATTVAVVTLLPAPPAGVPGSDKLHHILAFAALAFPLSVARPRLAPWVVLGVVAYGGLIEIIQPLTGRQAEWADLLADAVGAILGAAAGATLGMVRIRG